MQNTKNYWWKLLEKLFEVLSPLQIALAVFFILLLGTVLVRVAALQREKKVDYEVTFQEKSRNTAHRASNGAAKSGPNLLDPSVMYAERLREASAVAIGLSLATLDERLGNKKVLTDLNQIFETTQRKRLLPPNLTVDRNHKMLLSPLGLYYIRYRTEPFCFEVVSVGKRGFADGDVFVLRLPDEGLIENSNTVGIASSAFAAVWTAPSESALFPGAFAPAAVFEKAGWRREILRKSDVSPEKMAEATSILNRLAANAQ